MTIWEAAWATAAATTYRSSSYRQVWNPLCRCWLECQQPCQSFHASSTRSLAVMQEPLSLVSTGTGHLQPKPVPSRAVEMVQYPVSMATQTEMTAERSAPEHRDMIAQDVYSDSTSNTEVTILALTNGKLIQLSKQSAAGINHNKELYVCSIILRRK